MAVSKFKTLVAAGAAAGAMVIGMMPANAASTTFTLSAGSAPKHTTVKFNGTTQGTSPQVTFQDVTAGQTLTCASATAPGKATTGKNLTGKKIGKITAASTKWNGCTGPLGIALKVKGIGTWKLNAVSYSAGVTTGTITGADAKVQTPDGSSCVFTVTGDVPVTFTNATQILSVSDSAADLVTSNVTGCFGLINNGDHASFKADYLVTASKSAYNPIAITSP